MYNFEELEKENYELVRKYADLSLGEKEYYYAMIEGKQRGRIFVDNTRSIAAVLFWHYCGFGFVAGNPDEIFMENVKRMVRKEHEYFLQDTEINQKKFVLQQNNDAIGKSLDNHSIEKYLDNDIIKIYLDNDSGIKRSERLYFVMGEIRPDVLELDKDYEIKVLDENILSRLTGHIIPSFSWASSEDFLKYGKGYCILHGKDIASFAFSAAVGGGKIDIGIETNQRYQDRGLAKIVANKMIDYAYEIGAQPVWGCAIENVASRKTAEGIGFMLAGKHAKYVKS